MIDILQMAAPAVLLLGFLRKAPSLLLIVLMLVLTFCSKFLWGLTPTPGVLDFIWGRGEWVFFPLFPWFVYCLLGLLCFRHFSLWRRSFLVSALVLVGVGLLLEKTAWLQSDLYNYYRSSPAQILWTSGFCLLWFRAAQFITQLPLWKSENLSKLLKAGSQNVTAIYFTSWICIGWLMVLHGYQQMDLTGLFLVLVEVLVLTALGVFGFRIFSNRK